MYLCAIKSNNVSCLLLSFRPCNCFEWFIPVGNSRRVVRHSDCTVHEALCIPCISTKTSVDPESQREKCANASQVRPGMSKFLPASSVPENFKTVRLSPRNGSTSQVRPLSFPLSTSRRKASATTMSRDRHDQIFDTKNWSKLFEATDHRRQLFVNVPDHWT